VAACVLRAMASAEGKPAGPVDVLPSPSSIIATSEWGFIVTSAAERATCLRVRGVIRLTSQCLGTPSGLPTDSRKSISRGLPRTRWRNSDTSDGQLIRSYAIRDPRAVIPLSTSAAVVLSMAAASGPVLITALTSGTERVISRLNAQLSDAAQARYPVAACEGMAVIATQIADPSNLPNARLSAVSLSTGEIMQVATVPNSAGDIELACNGSVAFVDAEIGGLFRVNLVRDTVTGPWGGSGLGPFASIGTELWPISASSPATHLQCVDASTGASCAEATILNAADSYLVAPSSGGGLWIVIDRELWRADLSRPS
jgi:hypothetical protein